jgi:HEAT repeat protein
MSKKESIPFEEALERLDAVTAPDDEVFYGLSGMHKDNLPDFTKVWVMLDDNRRAHIVEGAQDLAESDIEPDFRELFILGLGDSDARVRAAAVRGLNEDSDTGLITPLVRLLRNDPAEPVRAAAAEALGYFMYMAEVETINASRRKEIYDGLIYALRHAPEGSPVYRHALSSVAYADSGDVDFYLRGAIASDDAALKLQAVIGMGRSSNPDYRPLTRAEMLHVNPAIRREAARAAGELEDGDALPTLMELVDDPDADVRESAVLAMATIGGLEAKRAIETLQSSDNEDTKALADGAMELYQMLHGEFDFNMELFDEGARTSFHSVKPLAAKRKPPLS